MGEGGITSTVTAAYLDHRLHLSLSAFNAEQLDRVRSLFVHDNPEYRTWLKYKPTQFAPKKTVGTWNQSGGFLHLPRGRQDEVLEALDGKLLSIDDRRVAGKHHAHKLFGVVGRDYQVRLVDELQARETCLWRSPTACITGDSLIAINRGGKGFKVSLAHLVKMHRGGSVNGKKWDPSIPTLVRARGEDGIIRLIRMQDAYESGVKQVYRLRLVNGFEIRATVDHRIFTERGWVNLGDLRVDDLVHVEESSRPTPKRKKPRIHRIVRVARKHPFAGRKGVKPGKGGFTVLLHRLVFEAHVNGLSFEHYLRLLNGHEPLPPLTFFDPEVWAIHHKDENPRNNDIGNLQLMTHDEHKLEHRDHALENIAVRSVPMAIEKIERLGFEMTYDISMEAPNNFLANGIVVHNSGKTVAAFLAIERLQTWSLIVVPTQSLLDQWVKRVRESFKVEPAIVQGKRREVGPITIAMQKTLLDCIDDLAPHFGLIVCDEVQLFAAKSFNAIIEKCPARYRLGVSNDEHRADGREYLVHDQFGHPPEGAIVQRAELIEQGNIVDVEVRLVPTDFRLDWYSALDPKNKFLKRSQLLDVMINDTDRNAIAVSCAQWCLEEGEQVAILSDRREHCQILDSLVSQFAKTGRLMGGADDKSAFADSLDGFSSGDLRVVVGTFKAIGVGFESHKRLARGVFVTPVVTLETAKQQFMQYLGRFARAAPNEGKKNAIVYLLFDPHIHGDRPVRLVRKWVQVCRVYDPATTQFETAAEYLKGSRREKTQRREANDRDADDDQQDDLFVSRNRR
jgi:superfamily II DNA or RNA helicase